MIGNPSTLETDPNWRSMIEHTPRFRGYTGVEYIMKEQRNKDTSAIEGLVNGLDTVHIKEEVNQDDEFMTVSHVTAQEGPAWRSEE
jgi:hypothetical protein